MHPDSPLSADDLNAMADNLHNLTPEQLRSNLDKLLASLPDDVREQFLQHEIDARARPQRPVLSEVTPASLGALDEDEREQALIAYVDHNINLDDDRLAALLRLPRGLQVVYLSFLVEAEAVNGGLHQFFWNPSADFAELVAPALTDLGAAAAAEIFAQALEVARSESARREALRADGSWEAFVQSSEESFLRTFDSAFGDQAAGLAALRARFLQDNGPLLIHAAH